MSTILKPFQDAIVTNGARHFNEYLTSLALLGDPSEELAFKRRVGTVLLEAPTGTGKTLMAGRIAETVSQRHDVVWFWFAPFAGLIEQTEAVIRSEFPSLSVRSLRDDRNSIAAISGEVRVATWALISNEETTVHQPSELGETLEHFVAGVRDRGLRIGVVVDEAHHTFQTDTRAFDAYRKLLNPDLTLLLTATPRDRQIESFKRAMGLEAIERLAVSRDSAVEARLIKSGVVVGVYDRETEYDELIDFQKSALADAVKINRGIQEQLEEVGVPFTPLLLVQVDSSAGSVEQAREWLLELGLAPEAIRSHTADEPNPSLLADAHDETVEALIFKMAIATGFDAPRAFTLVSLRNARDPDFGVQIIGRILRVDRRLQALPELPKALQHGYVVLANKEGQQGLINAGERINAIRDNLQIKARLIALPTTDGAGVVAPLDPRGQAQMLQPHAPSGTVQRAAGSAAVSAGTPGTVSVETLFGLLDVPAPSSTQDAAKGQSSGGRAPSAAGAEADDTSSQEFRYPRDPLVPERFETALVRLEQQPLLDDVVNAFPFADVLADAHRTDLRVTLRLEEVFTRQVLEHRATQGALTDAQVERVAQARLFNVNRDGMLNPSLLQDKLAAALKREFEYHGWPQAHDDEAVVSALNKILALHPAKLDEAVSRAVARHTQAEPTRDPLPSELISPKQLPLDDRASYGVIPIDDLNTWEQAFVEFMQNDPHRIVVWWHRNPVRKPYSVAVPIPGQPNFYPDFIVKVNRPNRGNGIVLVETKREINDARGNAAEKAQAVHPTYGNVIMLHWEDQRVWRHVRYDPARNVNVLAERFELDHLRTYP